jgi:hypothetical protein
MTTSRTPAAPRSTDAQTRGRPLSQAMMATTEAVTAAHDAALHRAIDGVHWERRGILGRLTRIDS